MPLSSSVIDTSVGRPTSFDGETFHNTRAFDSILAAAAENVNNMMYVIQFIRLI